MPDLEMLLRDLRPAPDPAWAARLDTRVAQRFPRPPAWWKRPFIAFRENLFAFGAVGTVATGLIVLVLAAMNSTGGGADNEATSASMSSDAAATPAAAAEDSAGGSGGASGKFPQRTESASKAAPLAAQQRDVKTTTAITLTTTPDRVQSVSDRALRLRRTHTVGTTTGHQPRRIHRVRAARSSIWLTAAIR